MKNITLCRATCELRAGLQLGEWIGRDRVYLDLELALGPRLVPVLTVATIGGGPVWRYGGRRAIVLFERLSGRMVEPKGMEADGLRRVA